VLAAMALLFVALLCITLHSEQQGNPAIARLGVDQAAGAAQSGGNMEGKETRFGTAASALFATITTATPAEPSTACTLFHASRRSGAAVPDAAGRGRVRRCGYRAVLHAHLRIVGCSSRD